MKDEKPYRRSRKSTDMLSIREEAQRLALSPLIFQAVRAMFQFGMFEQLSAGCILEEIEKNTGLSEYAVKVLADMAIYSGLAAKDGNTYRLTRLGRWLADDKTTGINFNFVNDVCYRGIFYLPEALKSGRPEGLKMFGNWQTIYEGLTELPEEVRKSWFDFDNYYSDISFEEAISVLLRSKPGKVYDIGANSGRFGKLLLDADSGVSLVCFDLPKQLALAQKTIGENLRASYIPLNILTDELPKGADAIWMSQFLDCFNPERILYILNKAASALNPGGRIYILEPFIDRQRSAAAALSLAGTSLYFTAMANGYSRMYNQSEFEEYIAKAGLTLERDHQGIGDYDYTLLECSGGLKCPNGTTTGNFQQDM
jgi:SAM-dependent methyltransferase